MTDAVIVATIGAFASVLSVILAGRANHNAKRGREQVENNHSTNFREENDHRHAETLKRFDRIDSSVGEVRSDVRATRGDVSDLAERVHELERIEMTYPRRKGTTR